MSEQVNNRKDKGKLYDRPKFKGRNIARQEIGKYYLNMSKHE
jgi:hypothetical protein